MLTSRFAITVLLAAVATLLTAQASWAMPAFARQYNVTCALCHSAFPRLNEYGELFAANNFRMPNWRDTTMDVGDSRLALPKSFPIAVRAQAFVQARDGKDIDPATGPTGKSAHSDFQAPYMIKLLSSAPLSEHVSYYFYGMFAEKGRNGESIIEDAWFSHDDVFGTGVGATLGQFQISDLMFPREVRLTFQDYYVYRAAGVTYDRGLILERDLGPVGIGLGIVNGSGIEQNFSINSPGYKRPDRMFDNDSSKTTFGRIGVDAGPVNIGLFGLAGKQRSAAGFAGMDAGTRDSDKRIVGLDLSGGIGASTHWYAQGMWSTWKNFLDVTPDKDYRWFGAFVGVDFIPNDRWAYSLLYNYADAHDFSGTETVYEGIDINSVSFTVSNYLMRNLKLVFEVNADLLKKKAGGPPYVGHQTRENYVLLGLDTAF